jgi:chromosome condensin MukBEF ATPase and DNA-binding subunit MukB
MRKLMVEESNNTPQDESQQKKSGQQLGKENFEAFSKYLEGIKLQGKHLPSHNGQVNKTSMALACGFRRQTFETNNDVAMLLEQAIQDIGLDSGASPKSGRAEHTERRLDSSDRRVRELEERLALKTAEGETLRGRVKDLEEKLRQYSAFEEVMTTTGRRFIP